MGTAWGFGSGPARVCVCCVFFMFVCVHLPSGACSERPSTEGMCIFVRSLPSDIHPAAALNTEKRRERMRYTQKSLDLASCGEYDAVPTKHDPQRHSYSFPVSHTAQWECRSPPPARHAASAGSRQRLSVLVVLTVRRLCGRQVLCEAAQHLVR